MGVESVYSDDHSACIYKAIGFYTLSPLDIFAAFDNSSECNETNKLIMPHKRAKRSVRDADRQLQGTDNAPTSKNEGILAGQNAKFGGLSANMYRILNAEHIRKEKKERDSLKRKREEEGGCKSSKGAVDGSGKAVKDLKIMPGEKLKNFNACVLLALKDLFIC